MGLLDMKLVGQKKVMFINIEALFTFRLYPGLEKKLVCSCSADFWPISWKRIKENSFVTGWDWLVFSGISKSLWNCYWDKQNSYGKMRDYTEFLDEIGKNSYICVCEFSLSSYVIWWGWTKILKEYVRLVRIPYRVG